MARDPEAICMTIFLHFPDGFQSLWLSVDPYISRCMQLRLIHPCTPLTWRTSHEHYRFISPSALKQGKLVGQKVPLRVRDIWAIRVRLQLAEKTRDLALFNLAIDSKLRACDLTKLLVRDIGHVSSRATVMQQKTQHPVHFEIIEQTRTVLEAWMRQAHLRSEDFL